MKLKNLKEKVDYLYENKFGENEVYITLSDISIGGRAKVSFDYIVNGFDWEKGEIRIEPNEKIIRYKNNRDNIIPPIQISYENNGRKTVILNCPKCGTKLRKNDNFCFHCGQKVKGK